MKQKLRFTTFIFFLPILQKLMSINPFAAIQLDFKFFIFCLAILSALLLIVITYFFIVTISWINSGFKWRKLLPCLISLMVVVFIYYFIKSVINSKTRKIKNTLQNIPNLLITRNTELI